MQDTILHKQVYTYVDTMPKPLMGLDKLYETIDKAIKYSPPYDELEGRVYIAFVIEKNGKADGFRVIKDIANEKHFFANQIIKDLKNYKWTPGRCNNQVVAVLYIMAFHIGYKYN